MNHKLLLLLVGISFAFLFSSCSKYKREFKMLGRDYDLTLRNLYYESVYGDISFTDDVEKRKDFISDNFPNEKAKEDIFKTFVILGEAPGTRKLALFMANNSINYCFNVPTKQLNKNMEDNTYYEKQAFCTLADGVSNFIYNACYLANVPKKILLSPFYSIGFVDWLTNIILILWGTFMSIIFLFLGTIIGTLCNPIDTFANLIIGFIPISAIHPYGNYLTYWFKYVLATNLIVSFWDLAKGITMPLWQILVIVKYHTVYFICILVFLLLGVGAGAKK